MLVVDNIHTYYGEIHAVKGISFEVRKGSITTLIGANGAGKSTTIKSIIGILSPKVGSITLEGRPIHNLVADDIVRFGIGYVPEGRRVFPILTVDENLDMGAFIRNDKAGIDSDKQKMYELFPGLKDRKKQLAGSLSGGEQQMLAIGRALMSRPKLLLMDEPSLGLSPILVKAVFRIITDLNQEGITILLSEQNANAALKIANFGIVMETGTIRFADTAQALQENSIVRGIYLGVR
ncbi:MAG: ABC transporter ATP-binding protein [Brevefilum sp.]|nr:ABC transporter ATP-binding protein [Brevefilum sp.]